MKRRKLAEKRKQEHGDGGKNGREVTVLSYGGE
jgi:hypothetical protein